MDKREDKASERRTEFRYPADSPVGVSLRQPGWDQPLEGRLTDISVQGLRIVTSRYCLRGTLVEVHYGSLTIVAEVRHCKSLGTFEYALGLKIKEVTDTATGTSTRL